MIDVGTIVPSVADALDEIRTTFEDATVTTRGDGEGGAFVRIEPIDPGAPYAQRETWIGFRVTAQYPYADIYPLFVRSDLARADGRELGEGLSASTYDDQPAVQVSRRSNHLNPATDTAVLKVLKVLWWMASR